MHKCLVCNYDLKDNQVTCPNCKCDPRRVKVDELPDCNTKEEIFKEIEDLRQRRLELREKVTKNKRKRDAVVASAFILMIICIVLAMFNGYNGGYFILGAVVILVLWLCIDTFLRATYNSQYLDSISIANQILGLIQRLKQIVINDIAQELSLTPYQVEYKLEELFVIHPELKEDWWLIDGKIDVVKEAILNKENTK